MDDTSGMGLLVVSKLTVSGGVYMNLDVTGKLKSVKDKVDPMMKMVKNHPFEAAIGGMTLLGLISFMRMSNSLSGLCDTIRESKKK